MAFILVLQKYTENSLNLQHTQDKDRMYTSYSEYGLLGYPLGHSFSKEYFNQKFKVEEIPAAYLNFEFKDCDLFISKLNEYPRLMGFNVTIPHKKSIMRHMTRIDDSAKNIGAINVVKIIRYSSEKWEMVGFNTDVTGFCKSITPMLKSWHKKALVLGTGGASEAVKAGLVHLGIIPLLVSRTPRNGQIGYDELSKEILQSHTVIVNATPLGMYPNIDSYPPIPYNYISENHIAFDLVYNPLETTFMRKCAEMGAKTSNGLNMLHIQAEEAWKIWTSK